MKYGIFLKSVFFYTKKTWGKNFFLLLPYKKVLKITFVSNTYYFCDDCIFRVILHEMTR